MGWYQRRVHGTHPIFESDFDCLTDMAAHKSLRNKLILAKKQKQNRPVPTWFRFKTACKLLASTFGFALSWLRLVCSYDSVAEIIQHTLCIALRFAVDFA